MIILKILLCILAVMCLCITYFIIREYRKFAGSEESQTNSILNRFIIMAMAFGISSFFIITAVASIVYLFKNIIIQ